LSTTTSDCAGRAAHGSLWRLGAVLSLVLLACCSSCRKESAPAAGSAAVAVPDLPPVPDPAGLMAELWVSDPDRSWRKLRNQAGSRPALLPASFPMLAATLLELPHAVAGMFDANVPLLGALVTDPSGSAAWVLGLHVKSGRELAAALTSGADASYASRTDEASGVLLLEPKSKSNPTQPALGIVGNYLLVAESASVLFLAGPFVARTLPKRPPPSESIVLTARQQALAGPVAKQLQRLWREQASELKTLDQRNRQDRGGRAPDFGDPLAALNGVGASVDTLVELLKSARELRVVLEPLDDGLELRAELTPGQEGPAAEVVRELVVGGVEPLLTLPKNTLFGVLSRGSSSQREESAKSMSTRLRALFGERLSDGDKALIDETFVQLARGRGDFAAYGLIECNGGVCAVMRGAAGDVSAFNSGLKSLLKFPRIKAFSEPLRQFVGEITVRPSSTSVPGLPGRVDRAALTLKPARMQAAGRGAAQADVETFELLWRADSELVYAAAGRDAAPALLELTQGTKERSLASDALVSEAARRAGPVSFAAVVRPLAFTISEDKEVDRAAPIFISVGREGTGMRVRARAAKAVVRGLLQGAVEP
jgi:hypothetical protein